jgi:uncharacterized protein YkwD
MVRPSLLILLLSLALGLPGCSSPTAPSPDGSGAPPSVSGPSQIPAAIADLTNTERQRAGVATLRVNTRLANAAQLQADQVAQLQVLEHDLAGARYPTPQDRLAAAGYSWQAFGENLAMGQPSAAAAVAAWMDSPGQRSNILNPAFTEIGAGYATDAQGRPYYVQVFGNPR